MDELCTLLRPSMGLLRTPMPPDSARHQLFPLGAVGKLDWVPWASFAVPTDNGAKV